MSVDAQNREEAVAKLKEMMTQEALDEHMQQYHKSDEPKPTLEQSHAMIEQTVYQEQPAAMA